MVVLLLCAVLAPLASAPILLDLIGLGLDVATTKRSSAVIVEGETITLGGSSVKAMKKSLAEFDFTTVEFSDRLAIYEEAKTIRRLKRCDTGSLPFFLCPVFGKKRKLSGYQVIGKNAFEDRHK